MRKGLAYEFIAKWVIIVVMFVVVLGLIYTLLKPSQDSEIKNQIADMVQGSEIPICRAYSNLQVINEIDFQAISFARLTEKCNSTENNVTLGFVLSKNFFESFLIDFNFVENDEPLVFYRDKCDSFTGFKGIIVNANESKVLFHEGSQIQIISFKSGVGLCPIN